MRKNNNTNCRCDVVSQAQNARGCGSSYAPHSYIYICTLKTGNIKESAIEICIIFLFLSFFRLFYRNNDATLKGCLFLKHLFRTSRHGAAAAALLINNFMHISDLFHINIRYVNIQLYKKKYIYIEASTKEQYARVQKS